MNQRTNKDVDKHVETLKQEMNIEVSIAVDNARKLKKTISNGSGRLIFEVLTRKH